MQTRRAILSSLFAAAVTGAQAQENKPFIRIQGYTVCNSRGQGARAFLDLETGPVAPADLDVIRDRLDRRRNDLRNALEAMFSNAGNQSGIDRAEQRLKGILDEVMTEIAAATGNDISLRYDAKIAGDPAIRCARPS